MNNYELMTERALLYVCYCPVICEFNIYIFLILFLAFLLFLLLLPAAL